MQLTGLCTRAPLAAARPSAPRAIAGTRQLPLRNVTLRAEPENKEKRIEVRLPAGHNLAERFPKGLLSHKLLPSRELLNPSPPRWLMQDIPPNERVFSDQQVGEVGSQQDRTCW